MEGPQGLNTKNNQLPNKLQAALVIIVILFNLVGLVGFSIHALQAVFLKNSPLVFIIDAAGDYNKP